MGSHWFGACPRPYGSERIALIDDETLDAAYDAAEKLLRVSNDQFTDKAMAEHIRAAISRVVDEGRPDSRRVQQMPMALVRTEDGVRRSAPDVILGDLLADDHGGASGFELRAGTVARRIIMDGPRAVAVELEERATGKTTRVGTRHVVVAADSIRTPQLLHVSGIRPAALGRYLNEHPQVSLMAVLADGSGPIGADQERGNTSVMSDPSAMAIASSGVTWIPFNGESFPFHVQVAHVDPTTLGLAPDEAANLGPVISLAFFLPQDRDAENRVEFSDVENDWLGMPSPVFRYRRSANDNALIERAKSTATTIATSIGSPLRSEEPRVLPAGSSLHYQGTVRMGAVDDGTSVCDPTSLVWGTENVRVAGNGVIPTSTAANPTLTGVALATLGAQSIVRDLSRVRAAATVN
jgi:choline dehydrogenase-like flavoprotein